MPLVDEYGLCVGCGGHGMVMVRDESARWGYRIDSCGCCDGADRVTPPMEARIPN